MAAGAMVKPALMAAGGKYVRRNGGLPAMVWLGFYAFVFYLNHEKMAGTADGLVFPSKSRLFGLGIFDRCRCGD